MSSAPDIGERATRWAKPRSWPHFGVQIWSLSKRCPRIIHKAFVKKSKIWECCLITQRSQPGVGVLHFPSLFLHPVNAASLGGPHVTRPLFPREETIAPLQPLSTAVGWLFWGPERTLQLLHSHSFPSGEKTIYLAKAKSKHIEVNWNCSFFFFNGGVQFFWHIWIFSIWNLDMNHLTSVPQVRQERQVLPWKAVFQKSAQLGDYSFTDTIRTSK